jgi:galactitol-specific phosphotransferase system IIB component
LIKNLIAFVDNVSDRYISELMENARTKKKELDIIIEAKITAEQIKEIINGLTILLANVTNEQSDAEKIKGGIVKNVQ